MQGSGLDQSLIELVKARASQINGCAFCINMHTQDARKHGETEQRLYLLNAWCEAPLYTDRERAAPVFPRGRPSPFFRLEFFDGIARNSAGFALQLSSSA